MIVTVCTSDRLVVASDSRRIESDPTTKRRTGRFDDTSKVSVTGRFVLGQTGSVLPNPHAAWRTLPPVSTDSARQRLDRLLATLRAPAAGPSEYEQMINVYKFAGARPDGAGALVRFVGAMTGPQVVRRTVVTEVPFASIQGYDDVALVFLGIRARLVVALRRPLGEAEMIALVRGAIREAGEYTDLIGGPIHLAVVDAAGSRWIEGGRR